MSSTSFLQDIQYLLETQQYGGLLLENRIQFLKDKNQTIDTSHDSLALHKDPSDIIDHFAEIGDPSKNKQHTQWILGQYKKKNIRQEDMYRVRPALEHFDKYKSKLEKKDINQYKTVSELETAVRPHIGTASTKKEETIESINKGRTLVHEAKDGTKVYRLEPTEDGKKASIGIYGGGGHLGGTHTSWCTAADSDYNKFDHYSKQQPLHVIHTADGEVYQAHPHSEQLMDRHDEEVMGEDENDDGELVKHKHVHEISNALDNIPGGHIIKIKKQLPNVTHSDLNSAISLTPDDHNYYHSVVSAVNHPNITPDLLEKAFNNSVSPHIKRMIVSNPKIPNHILKNIIESPTQDYGVKYNSLSNPSLSHDDIRKYYTAQTDGELRENLISNRNTPKDVLKDAIDFGSSGDVSQALKHRNADVELLRYGVNKHPTQVYNALHNDNATPDIIDKGLEDKGWENQYGQKQAAEHKNASSENLHKALRSSNAAVRVAALENPNSDESHLKVALKDDDNYVVGNALRHPLLTPDHLHELISAGNIHPMLKDRIFTHHQLRKEDLNNALHSSDINTVMSAIKNKNSPNEILTKLVDHENYAISTHAQIELRKREKDDKRNT